MNRLQADTFENSDSIKLWTYEFCHLFLLYSLFSVAPIVLVFCVRSLFCYAVLGVLSSFAIIPLRKRELIALLLCHCFLDVMWLLVFCLSSSLCRDLVCCV